MRQQFFDLAAALCRQTRQNVAQVGSGIVSIETHRLHQTHHHGRAQFDVLIFGLPWERLPELSTITRV